MTHPKLVPKCCLKQLESPSLPGCVNEDRAYISITRMNTDYHIVHIKIVQKQMKHFTKAQQTNRKCNKVHHRVGNMLKMEQERNMRAQTVAYKNEI